MEEICFLSITNNILGTTRSVNKMKYNKNEGRSCHKCIHVSFSLVITR